MYHHAYLSECGGGGGIIPLILNVGIGQRGHLHSQYALSPVKG
jgi:hypothetical protein